MIRIPRLASGSTADMASKNPWTTAKTDMAAVGRSLYTAIQAIKSLKTMWAPILPFTSQKLHTMLGEEGQLFGQQLVETYQEESRSHLGLTYRGDGAVGRWESVAIPVGRQLPKPKPLFKRLDAEIADEELARLGPRPA